MNDKDTIIKELEKAVTIVERIEFSTRFNEETLDQARECAYSIHELIDKINSSRVFLKD